MMILRSVMKCLALSVLFFSGQAQSDDSIWDKSTEDFTGAMEITVYRSPTCGCCGAWIDHLKKHRFNVTDIKIDDLTTIKNRYGVADNLASCHTAITDGYIIEGHVPADDIKHLLKTRPDVAGLSVPAMPAGTPGMEMGGRKDPFAVIQFQKDGEWDVYKEYLEY